MYFRDGISCTILSFIIVLNKMEFGKFIEFIYLNSFTILVNFLDQIVNNMSEPVLKG